MARSTRPFFVTLILAHASVVATFGRLFKGLLNKTGCSEDENERCPEWAADGQCKDNSQFMALTCGRSCGLCEGRPVPVAAAAKPRRSGCHNEPGYNCTARAAAGECDSDKGEMLWRCPSACRVCPYLGVLHEALGCDDTNAACGEWARHGECHANPAYMLEACASACGACESKRRSCDRPPNTPPVIGKGDINATMLRILRDFPQFNPTPLSQPGGPHGPSAPWVMTLENFVSDEEAEAFTSSCAPHFSRSLAGDQLSPVRTSHQCWCSANECERHPLTQRVAERISNLTNAPVRYMEPFQVVRYEVGQFYRQHHDQNSGLFTPQGARIYTFFMYLNTPERGGGTKFNSLGLTVPAIKGNAVLWPSVTNLNPQYDEPKTYHEALPVEVGMKFASNVWIHNYDYRTPSGRNCLLTHTNTH